MRYKVYCLGLVSSLHFIVLTSHLIFLCKYAIKYFNKGFEYLFFSLEPSCGSAGKESAYNAGHLGLIPGLGRSPGEGKGCPLQHTGLENSMDCIVHGVAKSQTQLSNFHFHLRAINFTK